MLNLSTSLEKLRKRSLSSCCPSVCTSAALRGSTCDAEPYTSTFTACSLPLSAGSYARSATSWLPLPFSQRVAPKLSQRCDIPSNSASTPRCRAPALVGERNSTATLAVLLSVPLPRRASSTCSHPSPSMSAAATPAQSEWPSMLTFSWLSTVPSRRSSMTVAVWSPLL